MKLPPQERQELELGKDTEGNAFFDRRFLSA
jgi:hypothetical protein